MAGLRIPRPKDVREARAVQRALKARLELIPLQKRPKIIAAADAAFTEDKVVAVACLFSYPRLEFLAESVVIEKVTFPYISGFLAFREGPAVIKAIRKLKQRPDLVILDGQGIAHPEGMGLASQVGILLDMPTIGCAKSRLVGEYREPGRKKGSRSVLKYKKRAVGAALRTREGAKVLLVSPGHKTTIKDAVRIVLSCARGFRIIEPVRCTDRKTKVLKKALERAQKGK